MKRFINVLWVGVIALIALIELTPPNMFVP